MDSNCFINCKQQMTCHWQQVLRNKVAHPCWCSSDSHFCYRHTSNAWCRLLKRTGVNYIKTLYCLTSSSSSMFVDSELSISQTLLRPLHLRFSFLTIKKYQMWQNPFSYQNPVGFIALFKMQTIIEMARIGPSHTYPITSKTFPKPFNTYQDAKNSSRTSKIYPRP